MIFPDKIESKLGFDSVRQEVRHRCSCEGSRQKCDEMEFLTDFRAITERLEAVAEMVGASHSEGGVPLTGLADISEMLRAIKVPGTFLEIKDLIAVRRMIGCFADVDRFFASRRHENGKAVYPRLSDIAEPLRYVPPTIAAAIDRALDVTTGIIKDNASPQLADIRRQLRSMSGRVNSILRRVLANAVAAGFLDADTVPSMRDGRLVIPVSPMNKRKIQGIVHDESASGKTVFIEPAEVVEANNLTRELQIEEQREIVRILTAIADTLRPETELLADCADTVYQLDFILAKAKYAGAVGGQMPHLHDSPELEWYHACHPGLKLSLEKRGREIVPMDIKLTARERILVISGPNAGGKSVCLKTVGTLQYMTQCGLLPPAYENSHFGIFKELLVDIGDDQSLEDDLSTYSSHLRSMKFMLRHGSDRSLFLIDEMGSGTEPQIGGALAQAILDQMNRQKMWGVVTTHYQNLKHFAEETDGLVNGSMLYDRHLMQPMFRLSIGHPGSSFAVEIARKTGLPKEIIDEAEKIVGSDYINLDNYLLDITRDKRYWENKRLEIKRKEKQVEQKLEQFTTDADALRTQRREIIEEARREAKRILDSSNAVIERTIADIKNANAEREQTLEARRRLKEERIALERAKADAPTATALARAPKTKGKSSKSSNPGRRPEKLEVGTNVKLDGGSTVGTILQIEGNNATVAFGNLKTSVKLSRLTATNAAVRQEAKSSVSMNTIDSDHQRQLNFKQEIDVRGMRAEEAIQAVTYFIDDAIRFSIPRVRILHGTGTGALRQAIRQYLSTIGGVRSARDEDVRFGGAGITVVELA